MQRNCFQIASDQLCAVELMRTQVKVWSVVIELGSVMFIIAQCLATRAERYYFEADKECVYSASSLIKACKQLLFR